MSIFEEIVRSVISENVDVKSINDSIDNTYGVVINYRGEEGEHTGSRLIQPVAYGTTKKGFPAIRAFQPNGDTSSRVPSWKLFRLDRIERWEPHPEEKFDEPPGFDQQVLGRFNQNGDDGMSQVFKVAKFGQNGPVGGEPTEVNGPAMKGDAKIGLQKPTMNTVVNTQNSERPVQKQYTQGPITKQDVQAVNNEPEGIESLRRKLRDQDYVSKAIKDADFEDNNEEETEDNGQEYSGEQHQKRQTVDERPELQREG